MGSVVGKLVINGARVHRAVEYGLRHVRPGNHRLSAVQRRVLLQKARIDVARHLSPGAVVSNSGAGDADATGGSLCLDWRAWYSRSRGVDAIKRAHCRRQTYIARIP
jgi:hypothetical protein